GTGRPSGAAWGRAPVDAANPALPRLGVHPPANSIRAAIPEALRRQLDLTVHLPSEAPCRGLGGASIAAVNRALNEDFSACPSRTIQVFCRDICDLHTDLHSCGKSFTTPPRALAFLDFSIPQGLWI